MNKQGILKEKRTDSIRGNIKRNVIADKGKSMALTLLASFLLVLIWVNRSSVCPDNIAIWLSDSFASIGRGQGFPVQIAGNKVTPGNFAIMDGSVIELSDTDFVCLNNTGKKITDRKHSFSNPMMRINGCRVIVYDGGNKGYSLQSRSKEIYKGKCRNNILCAGISKNGIYGIVTESKDYLSEMTIFDRNGKEKYKYYFAGCYISDISLSDNGRSAVVCGMTSDNGEIKSMVYIFDLNSEEPKHVFDYPGNLVFRVEYFSNGNIVAIGDKQISVINPWIGSNKDISYGYKKLICFDIDKDSGMAYAISHTETGQNCELLVIDRTGNELSDIHTNNNVKSLSYKGERIAVLDDSKIFAYNLSGGADGEWETGGGVKRLILNSSSVGYTVGICNINKILLK